jgi:hypothetical protein
MNHYLLIYHYPDLNSKNIKIVYFVIHVKNGLEFLIKIWCLQHWNTNELKNTTLRIFKNDCKLKVTK